jgi:pyruvate/2-oxoglutarate dehydrogenase complex dihydrolipoamide acyltransferase (E2) component
MALRGRGGWHDPGGMDPASSGGYQRHPFPRARRLIVDAGRATRNRHPIHALIEVDVTRARQLIRTHELATGERISFTAFVVACVARTVAAEPAVHAFRDLRGRLVLFDEVDVSVITEVLVEGRPFPMNHVVRLAERRGVADISRELQQVKRDPSTSPSLRMAGRVKWFLLLPGSLRSSALRLLYRLPQRHKALAGTVGVTAVGMFGHGGGWGIAFQSYPLEVVVGGIERKPAVVAGSVVPRELLDLTLSFDHDVVDGAPAARFASHLRELVESADGLPPRTAAAGARRLV